MATEHKSLHSTLMGREVSFAALSRWNSEVALMYGGTGRGSKSEESEALLLSVTLPKNTLSSRLQGHAM